MALRGYVGRGQGFPSQTRTSARPRGRARTPALEADIGLVIDWLRCVVASGLYISWLERRRSFFLRAFFRSKGRRVGTLQV